MFQILPKGRAIEKFKRLCQSSNDKIFDDIYYRSLTLIARPSVPKSGKAYLGTAGFKLQEVTKVE